MGAWYTTREVVKAAMDSKESARNNAQIDRAIESASRTTESLLNRIFYPLTTTKYFDWPNLQYARPWRLWVEQHDIISITTLVAGGITISASDYFLEPVNDGPPYTHLEIDLDSSASFAAGATPQRAIAITGVFGFSVDSADAGTLAANISSTSATTCNVSNSAVIGVGSIIKIDSERMLVTEKSMLTTGQTLQTPLTAQNSNVTVAVTTGSSYNIGEVILLDSERMLVLDISGNNLTVIRAWDGSPLAAHTGSTIYAPRTLSITRAALGTTAATHTSSTAITKHVVPGPVEALTVAYALNQLYQENSGYARVAGSGENAKEFTGRGVAALERDAISACGRQARIRAV